MKKDSETPNFPTFKPSKLQTFKPVCLTIAASDTSGGAGIQRDLKTFHDLGVNGLSVVTGITAQTDKKVYYSQALPVEQIEVQLKIVFGNYSISAIKIGVVFKIEIMKCISQLLKKNKQKNIVIDPILKASDAYSFLDKASYSYMKNEFLKIANIITPNVPELEKLSGLSISNNDELIFAAKKLSQRYDSYIFAKGGHLQNQDDIKDYIVNGNSIEVFSTPNRDLSDVHGTGCLISSAITAFLARNYDINIAIIKAKEYFYSILP